MVGACVLGNMNNPVFGVNHILPGGHRCHAEVAAYQNYIARWGKTGLDGAIIITTLSPCSSDIDQPNQMNCTDYINRIGIRKVYCGYTDPGQIDTGVWRHKKFHIMETRNRELREVCMDFASTFLPAEILPKGID
jgi:pyrimidine deaminase RibD-like protein